ncbi:hypothetical protein LTR56_010479 [Elasticomyces elasticus]|nr:hypothetical protein LTR56_010479 [Elasticomyces elasticus]KAK3657895.1 hypothetical protein LTR22_009122 [Elasticomyces elasticus]KAK4917581.1 hypothetical protein LTR49_014535 [Elasticomyces elasticus]KAK5762801.1 hypothetical protein LTS12_006990 [Elasticomyces elasticus]
MHLCDDGLRKFFWLNESFFAAHVASDNTVSQLLVTSDQENARDPATGDATSETNARVDILRKHNMLGRQISWIGACYHAAIANTPAYIPANHTNPASLPEKGEQNAKNPTKQNPMLTLLSLLLIAWVATKVAGLTIWLQTTKTCSWSKFSHSGQVRMSQSRKQPAFKPPVCKIMQNNSRGTDLHLLGRSLWKPMLQLLLLSSLPSITAYPTERPDYHSSTGQALDMLSSQLPCALLLLMGAFTAWQTCTSDMTPQERRTTLLLIAAVMAWIFPVLLSTVPDAKNVLFFSAFAWLAAWLGLVGVYMRTLKHQLFFIMLAAFVGLGIPAILYKKSTGNGEVFWRQTRDVIEFAGAFLITMWILVVFHAQWAVESWLDRGQMDLQRGTV